MNKNITIEDAKITFRNFSGRESLYNPKGNRNFCVLIDENMANSLLEDGWNIRYLPQREDDETPQAYLQVHIRFDVLPPKIIIITSKGKNALSDDTVASLDWAEIENIDLIIRPYNWVRNENTKKETRGIKAFVKSMYITISEDFLEKKYSDITVVGEHIDADN